MSRAEDGHEKVRAKTRQGMVSMREEGDTVNLIPSGSGVRLAVALGLPTLKLVVAFEYVGPNGRVSV